MKFLRIILGLLAVLVLIFLIRGLMTESVTYESEINVDKPVNEAFAVMNDESKINLWLESITNVKHISGTKGEIGAVTEYTFNEAGQESIIYETLKSTTPNKQVQLDFDAPGVMGMEYTVDFSEQDGKTSIKSTTVVTGQGFFMKCLLPWIGGSLASQEDINMSKLQKLINENTTNYFPAAVVEETIEEVESK